MLANIQKDPKSYHYLAVNGDAERGNTVALYVSPSKRVERLETALKPFADLNTRLERDYPGYKDAVSVFFELTHGDFRRALQALQGGRS